MPNLSFDFTDRTAIVTGAARGIGLELARHLHAAGPAVFLLDFDAEEVDGAAGVGGVRSGLRRQQYRVCRRGGVSGCRRDRPPGHRRQQRRRPPRPGAVEAPGRRLGGRHGGASRGTFRTTRAATPHFRAQQYGRVINVTSYSGLHGNVGQANYAAAKARIVGFTRTAAEELDGFGVTVNAISPNAETQMITSIPDEKKLELTAAIQMGRFTSPEKNMAAAVSFLTAEEAGYIPGNVLPVDGWMSM